MVAVLQPNNNMHLHIIPTDDQVENYTIACQSLTPTASDFHKNQFPRKFKTTTVIPNNIQHIIAPQTTSSINNNNM